MRNIKLRKKHNSTSPSSTNEIDDVPSISENSVDTSVSTSETTHQCIELQPKSPVILPNSDIEGLLECPVCSSSMYPPIQQCPSGHTLCSACKNRVNNKCPICRKEIGNIRCLALEKLAVSLRLPCSYNDFGCEGRFPYYSKLQHEEKCIYRPHACPHPGTGCPFTGDLHTLLSHLRENHKVDLQSGCTFNHKYVKKDPCTVDNVSWTLTLFNCFDQYFCLHFQSFLLGSQPVYMAFLRFMGEESEARKFSYRLEVGGNGRKLIWQGVPRSIRTPHNNIRDSHDGLIVHRSMALYFSGGDANELKLRVTGRIWKEV